MMYAVNAMGVLRVGHEGETLGLDLHEHGISAYPEYVLTATPRPAAMVAGEGARVEAAASLQLGTEPAH